MSLYDRKKYDSNYYYDFYSYDLDGEGGASKLKQQVIHIFKDMAKEIETDDYPVPVFDESGENTVDEAFYKWYYDEGGRKALLAKVDEYFSKGDKTCAAGYSPPKDAKEVINIIMRDIEYKVTHSKLLKIGDNK